MKRDGIISNKIKGIMAILFLSISYYMMITTKYIGALGDYFLKLIGMKLWTGEYTGMHLTIVYFGILTILGVYLVNKYAIERLGIRKRIILLIFIVCINIISSMTDFTARYIKNHSGGLLSVGFNSKNSKMEYKSKGMEYTYFNAEIEMVNYGGHSKTFYLTIDRPIYEKGDNMNIDILTKDGNEAAFELDGNETKTFRINLDEYKICSEGLGRNSGGKGTIKELILTDDNGNLVKLNDNNSFGVEMSKE